MMKIHLFEITPEELVAKVIFELKQSQELATPKFYKAPEEYLTVKNVAKLLQVSISTVNNWKRDGVLRAHQIGGRIYFLRSEIDSAFVELKSDRHER